MIRIRNLNKQYDTGMVHALKDISLDVFKGEICSIMGPSGSGKSTLLNIIGTLDRPTSGKIFIDGHPLESVSNAKYRNRTVGFVFQQHNLLPNITLMENVELPLFARRGINHRQRQDKVMKLLSELGIAHRASFYPVQVSVGERQRAAVARALVNHPDILLADEPTGSVDSYAGTLIMDAILKRREDHDMTVLIVTHNPEIAQRTTRVIFMRDGKLDIEAEH